MMRLVALSTCPVWRNPDGTRRPGLNFEPNHPPVVGWCCVAHIDLRGVRHRLVLNMEAL